MIKIVEVVFVKKKNKKKKEKIVEVVNGPMVSDFAVPDNCKLFWIRARPL